MCECVCVYVCMYIYIYVCVRLSEKRPMETISPIGLMTMMLMMMMMISFFVCTEGGSSSTTTAASSIPQIHNSQNRLGMKRKASQMTGGTLDAQTVLLRICQVGK